MKKILFCVYCLGIGGIEKCLVNLINALPVDRYDVDILLMNPEYDFRDQLRRPVRFLPMFDYVTNVHDTMLEVQRRGRVLRAVDYAEVDTRLENARASSVEFLREALRTEWRTQP